MTQSNKGGKFRILSVIGIAMYASVHEPKKAFVEGEVPSYVLDLIVSDEEAKKLEAEGLQVAKKIVDEYTKKPLEYEGYEGQKVFRFKRKAVSKDRDTGETKHKAPLEVVDANAVPIPTNILIGNGSLVNVALSPWSLPIKGKQVVGAELIGVQVLDLKEFTKQTTFTKTEGFTVHTSQTFTAGEAAQVGVTHTLSVKDPNDPFGEI